MQAWCTLARRRRLLPLSPALVALVVLASPGRRPVQVLSHQYLIFAHHPLPYRHEISSGYKGQREACPPQVSAAANRLVVLLPLLGIPVVREAGWEADDVIGTLALRAVEVGGC